MMERKIVDLEAERADLRQRLIGGVAGVQAGRNMTKWAKANDRYLGQSSYYLALTPEQLRDLADRVERQGHDALAAAVAYRERADEIEAKQR